MTKQCECCGKNIEIVFGSTKFCTKCSLFVHELKQENHILRRRLERKTKRIKEYGSKFILMGIKK